MVRRSDSKCAMIIISLIMIIAAAQLLAATPERNGCGTPAAPGPASVLSRGYSGEKISQSPPVTLALTWGAETSLPETLGRYAHAQDPDNPSSLYVICGVSSGTYVNHTWRYDIGPGTWTALANAPAALEAPDAVITGGKLYLLGGGATNQMSIYDIATNSWSAGPALPRSVVYCSVGCYSGMIYMIGGDDNFMATDGVSNVVNIFDIAANAWTGTGTPMPTATCAAGYFQIGSYLYIVGGWDAAAPTNVNAVQRYDMATDTWSTGPAIPNAPADFTLAGNSQKLYAIGGDIDGGGYWDSSAQVQSLDLSAWPAGSWVADTSLPYAVQAMNSGFCTPAAVGGTHWLVGGLDASGGSPFTWHAEVYSTPAEACAPAAVSCATVWDQPLSTVNTNGHVDQDFPDIPTYSSYLADDFTNASPWMINMITVPGNGWGGFTTLMNATSLNWAIYADNAGIPAGYPGDGVTTPQWSLSLSPSDASIVLSNGTGGFPSNVDITLSAPPTIPAGTWWLVFWPVLNYVPDGQYGRQGSDTTNGYMTKIINPGGGFGFGTTWQDWTVISATLQDLAFSICGIEGAGCTLVISPTTLPNGEVGSLYDRTVTASGGTEPYTYAVTVGNLPAGITLDPDTGNLYGTPTTTGTYTFTITATDSLGCFVEYSYIVPIVPSGATCPTITLGPASLPAASVGTLYSAVISASGGAAPYTYSVSSSNLPPGISLDPATGVLDGTPTAQGTYNFLVTATDDNGCTVSRYFTIVVSTTCSAISINPPTLPSANVGTPYSQALSASGGTAPYSFSASGSLPPGVTLSPSGLLAGTPTTAGGYSFTVTATDANGCTGTMNYSLSVADAVQGPVIIQLKKLADPFRIRVTGSNLQNGIEVYINGVKWNKVKWRHQGKIVIKGDKALKAAVPKNTATEFRFVNPDGGSAIVNWQWP